MSILLNVAAAIIIWLTYAVGMGVLQNTLARVVALLRMSATRTSAAITSFLSSSAATIGAVAAAEVALPRFGVALSVLPIGVWGFAQLVGSARSFGNYKPDLPSMDLVFTGGDHDAPRYLFAGQFGGLLVGLIIAVLLHFLAW